MNDSNREAPRNDTPPTGAPIPRLHLLGGLVADLEADAQARYDAKQTGTALGALTGFPLLDERLGGCLAVGLHTIHGSPGIGKTAFALQVAASCGCPALLVTCEVLPVELLRRQAARVTGTFLGKFKNGTLTPAEVVSHATRGAAAAPLLALLDGTMAPVTPAVIVESVATVRALAPDNPHFLIVVDSLHTWADAYGAGEEYDRLNMAIAALRTVAVQEGAAVICVAERNRGSMKSGGQSAGAGSRKIEYSGETIIGLQADKADMEDTPVYDANGETEVQLIISKNRHGEAGKPLRLLFSGRCQRYRPADGNAPASAPDLSAGFPSRPSTAKANGKGKP